MHFYVERQRESQCMRMKMIKQMGPIVTIRKRGSRAHGCFTRHSYY